MSGININQIAVEWGYWATPRYEGEYPRVSAGFKELKCDPLYLSKYRSVPISDDLGMQIDKHMQTMRQLALDYYDVFMLTYVKRWNKCEICQHLNISRKEYYIRLKGSKKALLLMLSTGQTVFLV